MTVPTTNTYRTMNKLTYPVNVARNIARETVSTHYVLASDIELYTSPDLPGKFLEMIHNMSPDLPVEAKPKVFVLPIFEVDEKQTPPPNKTILVKKISFLVYSC